MMENGDGESGGSDDTVTTPSAFGESLSPNQLLPGQVDNPNILFGLFSGSGLPLLDHPLFRQQEAKHLQLPRSPQRSRSRNSLRISNSFPPVFTPNQADTSRGEVFSLARQLRSYIRPQSGPTSVLTKEEFIHKFCERKSEENAKQKAEKKFQEIVKKYKHREYLLRKEDYRFSTAMKDIILALVTRVLFGAHALIAIWRAYTEYSTVTMWLLLVPVGLLILEALFTVGARGGEEYKWVSPCVILYLASVVPSVWFLEMKNFDNRQGRHLCNDLHWGLIAKPGCNDDFLHKDFGRRLDNILSNVSLRKEACEEESRYLDELRRAGNGSILTLLTTTAASNDLTTQGEKIDGAVGDVIESFEKGKEVLDDLLQNIDIFTETTWVLVLHQLLLFFLIVGRWLLPTGEGISKDQLSQLLLVFIGVGADILEFVTETVKEIEVRCDRVLLIIIMAFWSWSTLQFSLVLTATKARRTRAVGIYEGEDENDSPVVVVEEEDRPNKCTRFVKNMEVWGILSTLILQDGPFLSTRLYIMIGRGVVHQMIVFFTTKNALVVILQIYRLAIIAFHKEKSEDENEDDFDVSALGALQGAVLGNVSAKPSPKEIKKNGGEETKYTTPNDVSTGVTEVTEEKEVSNTSNNNNRRSRVAFLHVPSSPSV